MKNLTALMFAAALAACGGGASPGLTKGASIEGYAALPASAQSVQLEVFSDAAGTTSVGVFNVPTCTTSIKTACWDKSASKFNAFTIDLPGSAAPGTPYWLTARFFSTTNWTGTAIAVIALQPFNVIAGQVNNISISQAVVETVSGPGVIIGTLSATPKTVITNQTPASTSQLLASAVDPTGPATLTYAWTLGAGGSNPGCTGSSLSDPAIANPVFTPGTTIGNCTVSLTVTSSNAGVPAATRTLAITVANDTSIVVGGLPPPVITSFGIASNNSADGACTITKPVAGWAGANTTCPAAFALVTAPANPSNPYAAQGYFGDLIVKYDVGGAGINPNAPPSVTTTVFCTNVASEYGTDATCPAGAAAPTCKSVSFPAGNMINVPAPPAVATAVQTDSYWAEPAFSVTLPAGYEPTISYAIGDKVMFNGLRYTALTASTGATPDASPADWSATPFVAGDYAADATGPALCTFTVKVTNQGGSDTVKFYAQFQ